MDVLTAVTGSSLFGGLSAAQCEPFAALGRMQHVARHEHLFRLGQSAEALLIVHSGIVELTMPLSMNGKEREVVVQEAAEGETIAWSALVEPHRFTMSARAGTDVEVLAFSAAELQRAIEAHPEAGLQVVTNLARVIARRLQVMHTMWTRELQRAVNDRFR
jgi:CRP-like cAMP-binding protein